MVPLRRRADAHQHQAAGSPALSRPDPAVSARLTRQIALRQVRCCAMTDPFRGESWLALTMPKPEEALSGGKGVSLLSWARPPLRGSLSSDDKSEREAGIDSVEARWPPSGKNDGWH